MSAPEAAPAEDPWGDVLLAWAGAIALAWAAYRLAPEPARPALAAGAWVLVPLAFAAWRRLPLASLGLRPIRPLRALGWTALLAVLVLPAYAAAYVAWHVVGLGLSGFAAPGLALLVGHLGHQFVVAGLPEEVFFRGLVHERLARRYASARPRLGLACPPAVVGSAALFAVTHVVFLAEPISLAGLERLTTFFPGLLFGVLRERSGSIYGPALLHALCNAWLFWLQIGLGAG